MGRHPTSNRRSRHLAKETLRHVEGDEDTGPLASAEALHLARSEPVIPDLHLPHVRETRVPDLFELAIESVMVHPEPRDSETNRAREPIAVPSLFPVAINVPREPAARARRTRDLFPMILGVMLAVGVGTLVLVDRVQSRRPVVASVARIENTTHAASALAPVREASAVSARMDPVAMTATTPTALLPSPRIAARSMTTRVAPSRAASDAVSSLGREAARSPNATLDQAATDTPAIAAIEPRVTDTRAAADDPAACRARCHSEVDCLLRCFQPMFPSETRVVHRTAPPPMVSTEAPTAPRESDVRRALADISDQVRWCAGGVVGHTTLTVNFVSSGRVTTAGVGLPYAGTPVGSCIARAIRAAHVEPFTNATSQFVIDYHIP